MALSDFTLVTLVTFLLGGGASRDLLDYVPVEAYWEAKKVVVTPDALLAELRPAPAAGDLGDLIGQLGAADAASREAAATKIRSLGTAAIPTLQKEADSDDIEIARRAKSLISEINAATQPARVRRLMAIRTLGERKERRALGLLKPLADSPEPFVAAYARRAVARIEGKSGDAAQFGDAAPSGGSVRNDLWLLPANCAAVGQFEPRPGLSQRFDEAIAPMHVLPVQKKDRLDALTGSVLELADQIGNVRIDGVTLGVSDDFGATGGFVVAVVRGQFDRAAVAERVRQEGSPSGNVDGFDVFKMEDGGGGGGALFFPSDNLAVYLFGPDPEKLPTRELIAAARSGKGGLESADAMRDLLKSAATDQPLWAAARVTGAYKQFPMAAGFDRVLLVGRQTGATFKLEGSAEGTDPKQVDLSVHELRRYLKGSLDALHNMAPVMPPLQRVMHFLESIKADVNGAKLTATATFEGPVTRVVVFMNYPYATAKPVEEGKPLPAVPKPEEAPLDPTPRFNR
jgi:hypothetical protein